LRPKKKSNPRSATTFDEEETREMQKLKARREARVVRDANILKRIHGCNADEKRDLASTILASVEERKIMISNHINEENRESMRIMMQNEKRMEKREVDCQASRRYNLKNVLLENQKVAENKKVLLLHEKKIQNENERRRIENKYFENMFGASLS